MDHRYNAIYRGSAECAWSIQNSRLHAREPTVQGATQGCTKRSHRLIAVLSSTGRRAYSEGCLQTGNQVFKGFHEVRVVLQLVRVGRGGNSIRDLHNM